MASNRKLQGEIDRVLKQIGEHMQEFDAIWAKVHSAPTPNLKEKYEGDLKKEIKKLQRFRDQIKSWAANSDIKNKKPLLDARKSIETEMERFKVLEKETKTKAYSKEGLSSARNRARSGSNDGPMDPREDPTKRDTFAWLDELEEKLQEQVKEMDEKLEVLRASSKKKKTSAMTNDAIMDEVQAKMDRHNHHIERIQAIKDRLEHDELAIPSVEEIRDDMEYYATNHGDADFQEDETLYDALELDKEIDRSDGEGDEEVEETTVDDAASSAVAAAEEETVDAEVEAGEETEEVEEEEEDRAGTVSAILKNAGAKSTPLKGKTTAAGKPATSSTLPASSTASSVTAANLVKGRTAAAPATGPTPVVPAASPPSVSLASIVMKNQKAATPTATGVPTPTASPALAAGGKASPVTSKPVPAVPAANIPAVATTTAAGATAAAKAAAMPTIAPSQLGRVPATGAVAGKGVAMPTPLQPMMPPPGLSSQTPPPGLGTAVGVPGAGSAAELSGLPSTSLSGSAASSHLFPKDRTLVPDDYMLTLSLLEPSLRHLPDPVDSERPKQYIPRNPYRTPSYFPSVPAPIFDDPALFDKLSVDTLFFIFYFQQGTPHQYLAARELKKQSWRYHKNFLTWFQRHDDPKITTEEFEQGTYVYFDYEAGWCQRIKADFTFEYRHLEDELQVENTLTAAATPH